MKNFNAIESFGIDLTCVEDKEELKNTIRGTQDPEDTSISIILDLRNKIRMLRDMLNADESRRKIKHLMRTIKEIRKFAECKEDEFTDEWLNS